MNSFETEGRLNTKSPNRPPADPLGKLIFELSKLPGIGGKTANRLAYFILKQSDQYANALSDALMNAKKMTLLCDACCNFTDINPCRICTSERDPSLICIVEKPSDIAPIEQSGVFRGVYHVLHGVLSPLDGIGPEELKIRELIQRIQNGTPSVQELIFATNPSVEGDATALYISKLVQPVGVKLSKLAHGIPVGGQLEFTDHQTIGRALENRMEIH